MSGDRSQSNIDARTRPGSTELMSWRETSSTFLHKGLDYWRSDPGAALVLAGKKLWYFFTGRNYGDIYVPVLERRDGMASRLALSPLPTAWLTLPALLALIGLLRDPRRYFPEALLFAAPLLTVAIFWYSPRYRMPAVPICAALAGWLIADLLGRLRTPGARLLALPAVGVWFLSIASGSLNQRLDFDPITGLHEQFECMLGGVLVEQGRLREAEARFRRAAESGYVPAQAGLADVLRRLGRGSESVAALHEAVRRQPDDPFARRSLAIALAESGAHGEAEQEFRAALALDPNDWQSLGGLANVLQAAGRGKEAIEVHRSAIALNPSHAPAHYNLGHALFELERRSEAELEFGEALRLEPALAAARYYLAEILIQREDLEGASRLLNEGLRIAPGDPLLRRELDKVQRLSTSR
jgi:tetratricopeptide (TPR) repeat protein